MTKRMIEVKVVLEVWIDVPEDATEEQIDTAVQDSVSDHLNLESYDRTDGWYDPETKMSAEY
jgi:hypothetical protein